MGPTTAAAARSRDTSWRGSAGSGRAAVRERATHGPSVPARARPAILGYDSIGTRRTSTSTRFLLRPSTSCNYSEWPYKDGRTDRVRSHALPVRFAPPHPVNGHRPSTEPRVPAAAPRVFSLFCRT